MTYPKSIESRARRYAKDCKREQLLAYAERARKEKLPIARVLFRAIEIFDEDRSLMAAMAACDYLGDAVYDMRPNGPLPSDGVMK
jgi:hypothetical protein